MAHLYEITEDFERLMDMEITTDEDAAAMMALLEESQERFEDKVEGVLRVRQMLKGEVETIANEIDRLRQQKDAREKKIDKLMEYLRFHLEKMNMSEVKTATFKVKRVASKPVVIIEEDATLPPEFVVEKTTVTPDKAKIYEFIKGGGSLEKVTLRANEYLKVS